MPDTGPWRIRGTQLGESAGMIGAAEVARTMLSDGATATRTAGDAQLARAVLRD